MKCPQCGKEIPNQILDSKIVVRQEWMPLCDGVPDLCPFCGYDLWLRPKVKTYIGDTTKNRVEETLKEKGDDEK